MFGNNQVCFICGSESGNIACICDREIKLIGSQCLADHLRDTTAVHDLVDIELALRMQSDPALFNQYLEDSPDISKTLNSLKLYSSTIRTAKKQLQDERTTLFAGLEGVFTEIGGKLSEIEEVIHEKIKQLAAYKRTLGEEGRDIIKVSRAEGFESLFKNYFQRLSIPIYFILEYARRNIGIEYLNSGFISIDHDDVSGRLREEIAERDRRIEELIQEIAYQADKMRDFCKLEEDMIEAKKIIQDQKTEIEEMNIFIEDLGLTVDISAQNESNLRQEIEIFNQKFEKSKESYIESEKRYIFEIATLNQAMNELEGNKQSNLKEEQEKLARYKTELCNLNKKISTQKSELDAALKKNSELEKKIKLLESAAKQISQVEQTPASKDSSRIPQQIIEETKTPSSNIQPSSSIPRTHSANRASDKVYIYTAKSNTKRLIQYNIQAQTSTAIILEMNRDFDSTSTCELPNGDVFIAGFDDPVSSHVYLYKVGSNTCLRLPNIRYPRFDISLFYHKDFVYAFGGNESSKAERYNFKRDSWETLPNMIQPRSLASCVEIKDKIYMFSGKDSNIQVFDTTKLKFSQAKIKNAEQYDEFCLAIGTQDKIFLITSSFIQIYDHKLNKLHHFISSYDNEIEVMSSLLNLGNSYYYFNYIGIIEKISIPSPLIQPSTGYNNLAPYIYMTINFSTTIIRYNLSTLTYETINVDMSRSFNSCSVCLVDGGCVLIAGFCNPVSRECYLYNPTNNTFTKMPNLNIPRYYVGLVCHRSFIYAFGGRNAQNDVIRAAERINVYSQPWNRLRDMTQARCLPSCVVVEDKIYLIGGEAKSIEIYDPNKDTYKLFTNQLYQDFVVSYVVNDCIYIIGDYYHKVLTKDLDVQAELIFELKEVLSTYTTENVQVYNGKILFYNQLKAQIETFNTANYTRGFEIFNHT